MAAVQLYRAVRNLSVAIENDPEPMVQQQLARLKFMLKHLPLSGARVLEFGCGSGLNSAYLAENADIESVNGFDYSADAVALARSQYPDFTFSFGDGCDPHLSIEPGTWDVVFSTEVLEHVPDMPQFLANIKRHLKPGGVAFISTPNRDVFSCGHEPSPINKEHIKEPNASEFTALLDEHFDNFDVYGQRFKTHALRDMWKQETLHKIELLKAGTRWNRAVPATSRLRSNPVINALYHFGPLHKLWKAYRRAVIEPAELKDAKRRQQYNYSDFEFTTDTRDALWFCAICY